MPISTPPSPPLPILHQERDLLVIDKPAGLACHPGPRTPNSLEDLLPALARHLGQRRPPVLMHRLDRDTSGCLLLARTEAGRRHLAQAFERRTITKTYWALLARAPDADEGEIDAPLLKISSASAGWRMIVDPAGDEARTRWKLLDRAAALVELSPLTGRTHQLRIHMTCLGTAIRGDPIYGRASPDTGPIREPLRLHARSLAFPASPETSNIINVLSPPPPGWPHLPEVPATPSSS
jgi:tRNA pseudouridine32 synthase/23S rRNA pseudouridine746 synthase